MYAVVSSGGKQYRVEAGSELIIERLAADADGTITFDRVLLVGDGEDVTIGTPVVEGATVSATVLGEALGPKLIVFKFKQKATYRRKRGHRQHLVRVRIDEISAGGKRGTVAKAEPKAKADPKATADAALDAQDAKAKPAARTRKAPSKASTAKKATAADGESKAEAANAEAAEPKKKPAPRRRTPAKKAKAEE
jgi:large subunit ribosomal protein L21